MNRFCQEGNAAMHALALHDQGAYCMFKDHEIALKSREEDYLACVRKFDSTRAAIARYLDKRGVDPMDQLEEDETPWHEWLIAQLEMLDQTTGN